MSARHGFFRLSRRAARLSTAALSPARLRKAIDMATSLSPARLLRPPALPLPLAAPRGPGLVEIGEFGTNPGGLRMLAYTPPRLRRGSPLLVVLHGCGQQAVDFARDGGWMALADQLGAALVLPEQAAENNHARCFNWFRPADARRGRGEALSIRQMVRAGLKRFHADPRRVFVAGFSAGGAMTAALLAAYPNVFAAGAVVAGMPVGTAISPGQALLHMNRPESGRSRAEWALRVRAQLPDSATRKWPRLTIWQGLRDRTVAAGNAELLAAQWSELHGLPAEPATDTTAPGGTRRRAWGAPGRPAVELWTLDPIGHQFPVNPRQPGGGQEGAWVGDAGLAAVPLIAAFWGLTGKCTK